MGEGHGGAGVCGAGGGEGEGEEGEEVGAAMSVDLGRGAASLGDSGAVTRLFKSCLGIAGDGKVKTGKFRKVLDSVLLCK